MCQGLPCFGARVKLNRRQLHEGVELAPGTEGIVEEEFQQTREVTVRIDFQGRTYRIRVGEYDVDVIQRPAR